MPMGYTATSVFFITFEGKNSYLWRRLVGKILPLAELEGKILRLAKLDGKKNFPSRRPARKCFEFVRMVFGGQFLKEIVRKRHCDLKIFAPAAGYPIQCYFHQL